MKYPVNEIFETIQGEAMFTGTPAIFVRLQGCPVGCGRCDTKHTWVVDENKKTIINEIIIKNADSPCYAEMSTDELLGIVTSYSANHVVITGGEPCLYDLTELTKALTDNGYSVQIETSGTHEIKCYPTTFVTVSPKVDMPGGFKILKSAINMADEIKYPVGKLDDITKLKILIADHEIEFTPIWLQPLSQSKKATQICVEHAIKNQWKISLQTHKYMNVR